MKTYPRNHGSLLVQMKKLKKNLAKVEKNFETASALRKARLLKIGKRITERLDTLGKMIKLSEREVING
ncbi:hypothetical protein LCGC14_2209330 [marine sediment metagenome]|uniref:Uncharacterized protein n=1 Tax=marine sediment metagenome TaxID=412755 RepID=A0A0F9DEF4_9ZZZZ